MTDTIRQHIELVAGPNGLKPRIAGQRVRVQDVAIWHEKQGMSPDEIVDCYPELSLADVHAALAYYWDHRAEIEATIAADRAFAEEMQRTNVSPLREKLNQRSRD
jgi:uncharacterized protein (DUF433 family)